MIYSRAEADEIDRARGLPVERGDRHSREVWCEEEGCWHRDIGHREWIRVAPREGENCGPPR